MAISLGLFCGFATAQADPKKDINTTTGRAAPEEKGLAPRLDWTARHQIRWRAAGKPARPESARNAASAGRINENRR
jgi:hypothetical protein